jgi:signal transduction histidine kinase
MKLEPFSRLRLHHKLLLLHGLVTLGAVALAEVVAWGVGVRAPSRALLTVALAGVFGAVLGTWAVGPLARRVTRAEAIGRAWLRGNLALRIADPVPDDLGRLHHHLDQLAEHLEEDEQDLDQLRERNARLSDQVRALAVVEERNRLARELHDSVKQHLFSLAMTTGALRTRFAHMPHLAGEAVPGEAVEMTEEIERAAQAAQRETTRLIEDLRPDSLAERGLTEALNDYTLLFGAQEHLLVYLEVQGDDACLPPSVAEAFYRVTQEALHNVARHAQATRVDVHVRCTPERATLTVEDNGVGFDVAQPHRGLGRANMEERMMAVGGRLTLQSQRGVGTTIVAEVALPSAAAGGALPGRTPARPNLSAENWAWLGAKLVIPVGQDWPWLPADLYHLRQPLIEVAEAPLTARSVSGFLGLNRGYVLDSPAHGRPLVRVHQGRSGHEWEADDASWALRRVRGLSGRSVLTRNQQPLAAMQYQGRQMDTWTEIIYDGRGYRWAHTPADAAAYVLADEAGEALIHAEEGAGPKLALRRALPLPLIVMVTARILDETAVA